MKKNEGFWHQVASHAVALISLTIALFALLYSTWRDEETEKNRNTRQAAFEVLKHLGELQIVVNYSHYQQDTNMGNPLVGWGHVALISDMSHLLPRPVPQKAERLAEVWGEEGQKIKTDEASVEKISREIDAARQAVLDVLSHLR